jgi:hypothetical protein
MEAAHENPNTAKQLKKGHWIVTSLAHHHPTERWLTEPQLTHLHRLSTGSHHQNHNQGGYTRWRSQLVRFPTTSLRTSV